jgi:outer membrane protein OmpA-like peptidoglycan-associated protein
MVTALILTLAPPVWADDTGLLGLQIRAKVQVGGDKPALIINPQIDVRRLVVTLRPTTGGRSHTLRGGRTRRGQSRTLEWTQSLGTQEWEATFDVKYGTGQTSNQTITFEATVFPQLALRPIAKEHLRLDDNALELSINQPASRLDIKVTGDNGEIIYDESSEIDEEPDSLIDVQWDLPENIQVLKIDLRIWSAFGFWVGAELTPWSVNIPHEDVEFDTGRADIRPNEAPKIDTTLTLIQENIDKYGDLVRLQLFVSGHTDTVGSPGSNRELSERRARAIGNYFRQQGIRVSIYYRGAGEEELAVETPDETNEPRNRRAVYTLQASPSSQNEITPAGWRRL